MLAARASRIMAASPSGYGKNGLGEDGAVSQGGRAMQSHWPEIVCLSPANKVRRFSSDAANPFKSAGKPAESDGCRQSFSRVRPMTRICAFEAREYSVAGPAWRRKDGQALVPEMNNWRGKSARVLFTDSGIAVFRRALLSALWKDDASYRHQPFTFCRPTGRPAWPRFGVCDRRVPGESIDFAKRTSVRRRRVFPLPVAERSDPHDALYRLTAPPALKTQPARVQD